MRLSASTLALLLFVAPASRAGDADDLDGAFRRLKEAQAQSDTAGVKRLAAELHRIARQIVTAPPPAGEGENEWWTNHVANARSADLFAEYALYVTAIKATPATMVDLLSALEEQNPKSKYLDAAYGPYLVALSRVGGPAKAAAVAERALGNFPENEDLLLVALDTSMNRKQTDRALTYANRLVAGISRHSKPAEMSAVDWERKRNFALAQGYWSAGVIYGEKGQYIAADKNLRAALPLLGGNDSKLGPALFHLGMANYQIGKMTLNKGRVLEGASFSERAAAIDGPYADQARHNALVMKAEAQRMR